MRTYSSKFGTALAGGLLLVQVAACTTQRTQSPELTTVFAPTACGYQATFPAAKAEQGNEDANSGASFYEWSIPSTRLSALCLPLPNDTSSVRDSDYLVRRLSMLAQRSGVTDVKIIVPAISNNQCGEIVGMIGVKFLHTLFCLSTNSEFVIETLSDGSEASDQLALAFIESAKKTESLKSSS